MDFIDLPWILPDLAPSRPTLTRERSRVQLRRQSSDSGAVKERCVFLERKCRKRSGLCVLFNSTVTALRTEEEITCVLPGTVDARNVITTDNLECH